jgi:hypothetical protein
MCLQRKYIMGRLALVDWGWKPDYDVDAFFEDYFLPEIRKRFGK